MQQYRFLMIGAHPDDMELRCGGLALRLRQKGHLVKFLSMTDGSAGHQNSNRPTMAKRRKEEAAATARIFNIDYEILPNPDGELEATLAVRRVLMGKIREFSPHVILTHRTVDYHPDHRACGQLVMDCAYMVNVPLVCPEVPAMTHAPVILSVWDPFTHPQPFQPDLVVPIDEFVERKIDGCLCHISQFYEWLPHINGWQEIRDAATTQEKTLLLRELLRNRFANEARLYPEQTPAGTQYAESFQWNEYGAALTEELRDVMAGTCVQTLYKQIELPQ